MTTEKPPATVAWAALLHIKAHPEEYDQANWGYQNACGSKFCFAGHVVLQAGYTILRANLYSSEEVGFMDAELVAAQDIPEELLRRCTIRPPGIRDNPLDVPVVHVGDLARAVLGLTNLQANEMFSGGNSLRDLEAYVTEWFGARP